MQLSSSTINLVKNNNKDTTSMIKDWVAAMSKFNKMTVGLIHGPRDWWWQISAGNEEIIGGHYEILTLE